MYGYFAITLNQESYKNGDFEKKSSSNEIAIVKIAIVKNRQDFVNEKISREYYICMKYLIFMNYYGFLFVYARNNLKSSTVIVYDIHSFYLISS